MSAFEDVPNGLALRLTSNYVAQSVESKGLQLWTQQLTQSSKLSWCSLVLVRMSLAFMMLAILMWDNFVYFFGAERLVSAIGGNGNLNTALLPLCVYLIFGAITTIWMSFGGRGHFKIAHPRMLTAHALLATIAFPTTMLAFFLYWFIDFRNRTSTVPFLESENGERVVALGHTLGLFVSLVDVIIVEQALFLGDVAYPIIFGLVYLLILHVGAGHPEMDIITQGGPQVDGKASHLMSEALTVGVAMPLCYVFFWLVARDRGHALLRNSKDKDIRQLMRQQDTLLAQPVAGNPFEPGAEMEGSGNPFNP